MIITIATPVILVYILFKIGNHEPKITNKQKRVRQLQDRYLK